MAMHNLRMEIHTRDTKLRSYHVVKSYCTPTLTMLESCFLVLFGTNYNFWEYIEPIIDTDDIVRYLF